jgi:hypothetical protein
MRSRFCLLVFLIAALLSAGCGKTHMAPVTGRVMFNGKPVAEAAVTFDPVPRSEDDQTPGKPATGFTDAEGYYVLSTYKAEDGALVGEHRVSVTLDDTNPARCKREKKLTLEVGPGSNVHNIEMDR